MTRLTRDRGALKHDDLIDVVSMAVSYWTELLGRDAIVAEQSAREQKFHQELDRFMKHTIGDKHKTKTSWIS